MRMRSSWLVLLLLVSCERPAPVCGPSTCAGCCDAQNTCRAGVELDTCGTRGAACSACVLGQTCALGVCQAFVVGGGSSAGGAAGGAPVAGGAAGGVAGGEAGGAPSSGGSAGGAIAGGAAGGSSGGTGGGASGGASTGGGASAGGSAGGAVTAGGSSAGGTAVCVPPLFSCGAECVDLTEDERHCGRCGTACGSGNLCINGACVSLPTCDAQRPCPVGAFCSNGRCSPGCDNAAQCPQPGACDGATNQCVCATGRHPCGASCRLDDDVTACGSACASCRVPPNGAALCVNGSCDFVCNPGFHRCGSDCVSNTSPASCGPSSCTPCASPPNATATCNGVSCDFSCVAGFHRCGSQCVPNTSVNSCGFSSCTPCVAPANATATCNGFTCGFTCNTGFHACGNQCVSNSSVSTCGSSCSSCPTPANSTATCNGVSCGFTCNVGFHRCGNQCLSNTSVNSCGSACTPCVPPANATATCNGTSCDFVCATGFHRCGSQCVPDTSTSSCGTSCTPCAPPANATATCDGVSCGFTCNAGSHLCAGQCVLDTSVNACGPSSCSPCPTPTNGIATCDGQTCGVSCNTGFHDCSGQCASNTSPATCGSRCSPCYAPPNATATCDGVACGFTCNPGTHLCNGLCVRDDSTLACGASCTECSPPGDAGVTAACVNGACTTRCLTSCAGRCVDSSNDPTNCGGCGVACAVGERCLAGRCERSCTWDVEGLARLSTMPVSAPPMEVGDFDDDGLVDVLLPTGWVRGTRDAGTLVFVPGPGSFPGAPAAVADFNRDGIDDFVTATGGSAVLRLGTLSGPGAPVTLGMSASSVATADFDRTNGPDLVVGSGTFVGVFFNSGSGTFTPGPAFTVGVSTGLDLVAGDVTADGVPDFAVALRPSSGTTWSMAAWIGSATGLSFTQGAFASLPRGSPNTLRMGDVDGDGRQELFWTTLTSPSSRVVDVGANGALTQQTNTGGLLAGAGDFTRDGIADRLGVGTYVSVAEMRSSGQQGTLQYVSSPLGGWADARFVDAEGDGDLDVIGVSSPSSVTALLNLDGGLSVGIDRWNVSWNPIFPDLNGDGRLDIVEENEFGDALHVRLSTGPGRFAAPTVLLATPNDSPTLAVVNVNGDAWDDVFVGLSGSFLLYLGTASGTPQLFSTTASLRQGVRPMVVDLDGDGARDVLYLSNFSNGNYSVFWHRASGSGVFEPEQVAVGQGTRTYAVGDLNRDGLPDIVIGNQFFITPHLNHGGFFLNSNSVSAAGDGLVLGLFDADRDGWLDVVRRAGFIPTDGLGRLGVPVPMSWAADVTSTTAAMDDLDRDGVPDFFDAFGNVRLSSGGSRRFVPASNTQVWSLDGDRNGRRDLLYSGETALFAAGVCR